MQRANHHKVVPSPTRRQLFSLPNGSYLDAPSLIYLLRLLIHLVHKLGRKHDLPVEGDGQTAMSAAKRDGADDQF